MGVPGLWDLLRPAAARTSLSALSKEAFQSNRNGLRAFTIGIDASIWIFHAQVTHYGENPFLRTIFFKITALLQQPVLPVFVFDGPNKPGQKRNQNVAGQFGTADHKSRQFKALLDVCGLEWWNAPGEAEAELAIMNRQGKIDAVLSDDVDALLFGATCVLRNNSPTLSGAQASTTRDNSAKGDMRNYEVYRSSAIKDLWTRKDGTTLSTEEDCRMAMTLIALLGGGDYTPEGLPSIGHTISFGLANAGLSDFLKQYNSDRAVFNSTLPSIHERIVEELRTNSSKQVGRRYPDRANKLSIIPPSAVFPTFTLDAYLNPCTSPLDDLSQGWPGFGKGESTRTRGKARNEGRGDMEGLAIACEKFFEWGTKEIVIKRFSSENVGIFGAEIMNQARQTVRSRSNSISNSHPLIHQSVGTSNAASTSMITSFFSQSMPSSSPIIPKSSQLSQPVSGDKEDDVDFGKPPKHVLKIHSTRLDPANGELTEYRISFQHEQYIRRVQNAMQGLRVDPEDLSDNSRQRIGLKEKSLGDDEMISGAQVGNNDKSKDEIRLWLSEYLVKEAWPSLIKDWEDEKAAKAAKKLGKSPKKKNTLVKPPPKGKNNKSVEKMYVGVFNAFYAAAAATSTSAQKPPDTIDIDSSSSEEEETIENLPPRRRSRSRSITIRSSPNRSPSMPNLLESAGYEVGKKTRARPCPTSSLSSLVESTPSRGGSPTPTKSRGGRPKTKTKRISSPSPSSIGLQVESEYKSESIDQSKNNKSPSPPKTKRSSSPKKWPFSKRIFSKSKSSPSTFFTSTTTTGKKDEPIDLCSSSDDGNDDTPIKASTSRPRRNSKNFRSQSSPIRIDDSDGEERTPVTKSKTSKKGKQKVDYVDISPTSSISPLPVLGNSTKSNTLSSPQLPFDRSSDPTTKSKTTNIRKSRSKSKEPVTMTASQQSLLDFPITVESLFPKSQSSARPKEQNNAKSKSKSTTPSPKKSPIRKKKPHYVVISETSDEEFIDCTRKK
ncbi:uncharacterized protein L201_000196 [Kwoniella dendrophila CBS 6074]|uniref:XPG-I domain-containing protein n=1 Tax=Kwoniella dendrophila CBS 6074 TaxID=1295534 RepID=A0AAX4JLQ8_9TREE